ncbi:MAG TPA: DUF2971 domain-containing protein [Usitatibacter sp.]|jgi:hypothetical protein|nr:DUF2971 domain-containing protein [Usitatibacter sp.]
MPADDALAIDNLPSRTLFEHEPPAELYHYTDLDSLSGIFQTRTLWMSKISTMNDTSEIGLAVHHFKRCVEAHAKDSDRAEAEFVLHVAAQLEGFRRTNICVASFCEEENQLNQWRSYGADGRGIALGFHSERLEKLAREHGLRLVPCVYEPGMHERIVEDLFQMLLAAYRADPPGEDVEARERLVERFNGTFLMAAPIIKDRHFAQEREWRLVSTPRPISDPRITASLSGKKASVKFVLPLAAEGESHPEIFSSLIIGPTLDPESVADAIEVLADRRGFRLPKVHISDIPYRPKR